MTNCGLKRVAKTIRIPKKLKSKPDRLPWPRTSAAGTELGIDVREKEQDIIKIVHKFFRVADVPMEELLQEVYVAIIHKNYTRSAHDPDKSSFGHYVYMVANNVCINLVHRKCRYDKDRNSLDAPVGPAGSRTLMDTLEDMAQRPDSDEMQRHVGEVEDVLRRRGLWDHARYCRMVMSGVDPDVIREAMSFGGRRVSSKMIRDMRAQVQGVILDSGLQA